MKEVGKVYETNDYSMFNYLSENRCSTTDVVQALKDGKSASRTKDFARRVNNFENAITNNGWSKIAILPVWEDENGVLYLGDGATRIQALKNLKEKGVANLPNILYTIHSHTTMTREDFVEQMRILNENNGKKWDITDKIELAVNFMHIPSAEDAMTIARKYQLPMNAVVNLVLNKQGTTKQDRAFYEQMRKNNTWEYAYEVAEFINELYMFCTTDIKNLIVSDKGIDSFRQIFNKAIETDKVEEFKEFWRTNINKVVFGGTKLTDYSRGYLDVMFNNQHKVKYSNLDMLFVALMPMYKSAICRYNRKVA